MNTKLSIGVVGYSKQKFNIPEATFIIESALGYLKTIFSTEDFEIVSGLTDLGIPSIAYAIAEKNNFATKGIACKKAQHYPCWNCDTVEIIGEDWGDESQHFLDSLKVLIRVGGGQQSHSEAQAAKNMGLMVLEFELLAEEQK